jgi:dTMP kinase
MIADRFETLERDFHERLRQGFLEIAAREPERCVVIDASGDMTTVHHAILSAVNARFGVSLT